MKLWQEQETTGGSSARNESIERDSEIDAPEMNPLALRTIRFIVCS